MVGAPSVGPTPGPAGPSRTSHGSSICLKWANEPHQDAAARVSLQGIKRFTAGRGANPAGGAPGGGFTAGRGANPAGGSPGGG
ncbi:hypothetical protein F511_03511 [Dorcoceras hygrometricum]|uniref:Uncharacterized protein n=1 Tax=Dorcoceras hygrometricum TaxID=472368 RepID=A0A2Z7A9I4_9LAMI|nr:hypothetical protein F511_03511 [Dorcoceras hygrometricum]